MHRLSFFIAVVSMLVAGVAVTNRLPGTTAQEISSMAPHGIVGAWHVTTYVEGQNPSPNMTTFYGDGNVLTSNRPVFPPTSDTAAPEARSAGHGAWVVVDDHTADFTFQVLTADINGTYLGTRTLQGRLTLDDTLNTWSAPYTATVTDPTGAVVSTVQGRAEGTRIAVMPMEAQGTPAAA